MMDDLILGVLCGMLGLLYLIGLRLKAVQNDVTCMHDFVHFLGDSHESLDVVVNAVNRIKGSRPDDQETPSPFKDWDES